VNASCPSYGHTYLELQRNMFIHDCSTIADLESLLQHTEEYAAFSEMFLKYCILLFPVD